MAYTIIINEGVNEFTFNSPRTSFTPSIRNRFNPAGFIDSSRFIMTITGTLRGTGANPDADVMQQWQDIRAVAERNTVQRVRIVRNSTIEIDLNPVDFITGPFITSFDVDPTPASFANHIRFRMIVEADQFAAGVGQPEEPDTQNIRRSITEEFFNGELVRKEWTGSASGDGAFGLVVGFQPQDVDPLRSTITRNIDDNSATSRFSHIPHAHNRVEEKFLLRCAGRPITPVLILPGLAEDGQDPILFRGRRRPAELTVEGRIVSTDETIIVPALHFAEENFDPTRSNQDLVPSLIDPVQRIFELRFREFYMFESDVDIPAPNHVDHVPFEEVEIPADGPIAG